MSLTLEPLASENFFIPIAASLEYVAKYAYANPLDPFSVNVQEAPKLDSSVRMGSYDGPRRRPLYLTNAWGIYSLATAADTGIRHPQRRGRLSEMQAVLTLGSEEDPAKKAPVASLELKKGHQEPPPHLSPLPQVVSVTGATS